MTVADIRAQIRKCRREKEWTLDDLVEASGVERTACHKIESVKKYPDYEPGLGTFLKLVAAFGMPVADFFSRLEDPSISLTRTQLTRLVEMGFPLPPLDPTPPAPGHRHAVPPKASRPRSSPATPRAKHKKQG